MKKLIIACCLFAVLLSFISVMADAEEALPAYDKANNYLYTVTGGRTYLSYVYKDSDAINERFSHFGRIPAVGKNYIGADQCWFPSGQDSAFDVAYSFEGLGILSDEEEKFDIASESNVGGWFYLNGRLDGGKIDPILDDEIPFLEYDLSGNSLMNIDFEVDANIERVEIFTVEDYALCGFPREIDPFENRENRIWIGSWFPGEDNSAYYIGDSREFTACGFGIRIVPKPDYRGSGTIRIKNISFAPDYYETPVNEENAFLCSYEVESGQNFLLNTAFTYDNALAAMAFLSDAEYNWDSSEQSSHILALLEWSIRHDRFQNGIVRNAYSAGPLNGVDWTGWEEKLLMEEEGESGPEQEDECDDECQYYRSLEEAESEAYAEPTYAPISGWWDNVAQRWNEDQYQVGTSTGIASFAALAFLQDDKNEYSYAFEHTITTAKMIVDWIIENCSDANPGFTGGFDGWPESDKMIKHTYKSTEHNADFYAVCTRLYELTGDQRYADAADSALTFIQKMYNPEKGYFYTGTGNDGVTPNTDIVSLDAQVWTVLALGEEAFTPYMKVFDTILAMQDAEGGFPFYVAGKDAGYWLEGTAFTALALRLYGFDEQADRALAAIEKLQRKDGALPAASVPELKTGLKLFTGEEQTYSQVAHIAPVAWYIMATNGFNPFDFSDTGE